VVFCAIAHPEEFVAGVRQNGGVIAAARTWGDHHQFSGRDIAKLRELAAERGTACFLTTAKDAVRFTDAQRERLEEVCPVLIAELVVKLRDPESALAALEERLRRDT
jgi:tetraacyldisaccharide 4'-kinase